MTEQAKETWEDYCRRTSGPNWAIRTEFSLLHGRAFRSLKRITTVKALFYFYEKRVVKVDKRKRGDKRFQVQHDAEIKFSYKEAEQRGLTRKRFAQAIRDLHAAGFIDILYRGSGALKDSSTYRLSERWRRFDTPDFKAQDIPLRLREEPTKNLEHDEKGRWTRKEEKPQVVISPLGQGSKRPLEITVQGPKRPLERGDFDQSSRVITSTELSTTRGSTSIQTVKKVKKKVRTLNRRSESTAAHRKTKKARIVAIPTWPDQGKVLDLCGDLLLDALERFGDDGDQPHPEMATARNLIKSVNRAVGSGATH